MPARNAPSASDSPAVCVIHAAVSVSSSTDSMKNSRSRADAISWNSGLSSQRPTNRIAASTSTLFTSTQPNVGHTDWPPAPPSAGIKIRNGTTIRSWNSNTPKAWRPWREFCSSCSMSSFMTMAVEDSASTPPMTIAPAAGTPRFQAMKPNTAQLMSTCAPPRPKTVCFMARSFGNENSRPMVNIRNTRPNSASVRVPATSGIQPSP